MKSYLKTKDYSVSGESFELLLDEELQMLITQPQPKNLSSYYQSENYISHTDSNTSFVDKLYQIVKKFSLKQKVNLINKHNSKAENILDIGAGTGEFLIAAQNNGWQISGVEPNHDARAKAKKKGVNLLQSIEEIGDDSHDIITLWHVLEHLPNLNVQIKKITSILKDDGTLIIAVPNYNSYDAKHYKNFWAAFDVPRHLWHFSKTSIKMLFEKEGLEVVKMKPMIFDSFYVSLLSEKYKFGKQNYLRAFYHGLLSNIKAIRTKESSSILYILKKTK